MLRLAMQYVGNESVLHTQTHTCTLMLHARTDTPDQIVVWQQNWLLYLSRCYSNKHHSLSLICCAKQSPYQHLAHHTALCQSGPQCQDCQAIAEAQTHFLSLCLPHGFILKPLSSPIKQSVNLHTSLRQVEPAPHSVTARPNWASSQFFCSYPLILTL